MFREPPLNMEMLFSFLVKKYPSAHFFIDEIPVKGKSNDRFSGIKIKGKQISLFVHCGYVDV
jgi:hypothetical protein